MLVAGEYGKTLRINAGLDISGASDYVLTVTHPKTPAASFTRNSPDVALGTIDATAQVEREDGSVVTKTFLANEYVSYVIQSANFPDPGIYKYQLQADFTAPAKRLKTITGSLVVHR